MQLSALDLRKNILIEYEGRMWTVIEWSIMRNDRRQKVFVTIKDLLSGRVKELTEHGDSRFEVLDKDNVELSHSYNDGLEAVFYDKDGGEHRCVLEAAKDALQWGSDSYIGFMVNEKLIMVSPPSSVVIKVKECAPPMKGGNNSWKDAVLENGVKVKVSNLVNVGERVRIDPVTLEFRERVTS